MIRMLLLAAGAAFLGSQLMKARPQQALPVADGPIPNTGANDSPEVTGDLQRAGPDLTAGMPSDMHADADVVRPGFADYARGA